MVRKLEAREMFLRRLKKKRRRGYLTGRRSLCWPAHPVSNPRSRSAWMAWPDAGFQRDLRVRSSSHKEETPFHGVTRRWSWEATRSAEVKQFHWRRLTSRAWRGSQCWPDAGRRQVVFDRARQVTFSSPWTLSVFDRTRGVCGSGHFEGHVRLVVDWLHWPFLIVVN
jgi:hypothetical protein